MSRLYNPPKYRRSTRIIGILIGLGISALLFLAIPLTQMFNTFKKDLEPVEEVNVAPPPPPPPPEEEPPPPPPPEEESLPELDTPPPPISLEQLDMSLNPGTGGPIAGDFALPTLDLSGNIAGIEIFELSDVDSPPEPLQRPNFKYPWAAKRRDITGVVKVTYIVNQEGRVENITIIESPDTILSKATEDVLRRISFKPATKDDTPVKVRMRAAIPYP